MSLFRLGTIIIIMLVDLSSKDQSQAAALLLLGSLAFGQWLRYDCSTITVNIRAYSPTTVSSAFVTTCFLNIPINPASALERYSSHQSTLWHHQAFRDQQWDATTVATQQNHRCRVSRKKENAYKSLLSRSCIVFEYLVTLLSVVIMRCLGPMDFLWTVDNYFLCFVSFNRKDATEGGIYWSVYWSGNSYVLVGKWYRFQWLSWRILRQRYGNEWVIESSVGSIFSRFVLFVFLIHVRLFVEKSLGYFLIYFGEANIGVRIVSSKCHANILIFICLIQIWCFIMNMM